jgi:hypothetical protein
MYLQHYKLNLYSHAIRSAVYCGLYRTVAMWWRRDSEISPNEKGSIAKILDNHKETELAIKVSKGVAPTYNYPKMRVGISVQGMSITCNADKERGSDVVRRKSK